MSDFGFNLGCTAAAPPEDPLIAWHKALALYGPPTAFEWCGETRLVQHYTNGVAHTLRLSPHPIMFTVRGCTVRQTVQRYWLRRDDDASLAAALFEPRMSKRGLPVIVTTAPEVVLETLFGPPPNIFGPAVLEGLTGPPP